MSFFQSEVLNNLSANKQACQFKKIQAKHMPENMWFFDVEDENESCLGYELLATNVFVMTLITRFIGDC
jgi:hypothetical protein